jgi:GMP synthase-like glutamine amidotransferase
MTGDYVPPVRRALVIQHVPVEGPYAIAEALERAGIEVDLRLAGTDPLPGPDDVLAHSALVVMGGPQDAHTDHDPTGAVFPTRDAEVALLRAAVGAGLPTLGVCLGAQLLAAAIGGRAVPGTAGREIGWSPVRFTADARSDTLFDGMPPELTVLHWHGDTVELPRRVLLLASSDRYPNQAFRVAPRAWGVQFHLEVTVDAVTGFVSAFDGEPAIAEQAPRNVAALAPHRTVVFDRFAALVCAAEHDRPSG